MRSKGLDQVMRSGWISWNGTFDVQGMTGPASGSRVGAQSTKPRPADS